MVTRKCQLCSEEFKTHSAWIRNGRGKYCSKRCALKVLHSKKYLDKVRLNWTGKKHSEETKEKISEIAFKNGHGKWNVGKKRTKATKQKLSRALRGKNNPNWKGGLSPLNKLLRKSLMYRTWRVAVFERDNHTCQVCRKKGSYLHADHIDPFSKILKRHGLRNFEQAKNCSELWDVKNGKTLCKECHMDTPTFGWGTMYQ